MRAPIRQRSRRRQRRGEPHTEHGLGVNPLGVWVNPHRKRQTIPQGQTSKSQSGHDEKRPTVKFALLRSTIHVAKKKKKSKNQTHTELGLYTILWLPILYGVWHTKGRSRGGRISPNSCAIVLQQGGQCRWVGGMEGRLIRAQTTRSQRLSCKGQHRIQWGCHPRYLGVVVVCLQWKNQTHTEDRASSDATPGIWVLWSCVCNARIRHTRNRASARVPPPGIFVVWSYVSG